MDNVNKTLVGARIKRIRISFGMTLDAFCEQFGATKGTVSAWETGKNLPNENRIKKIADFANLSESELLFDDPLSNSLIEKYKILLANRKRERDMYLKIQKEEADKRRFSTEIASMVLVEQLESNIADIEQFISDLVGMG